MARNLLSVFTILALAIASCSAQCDGNTNTWLENRANHVPTDLTNDPSSLIYLAETLSDEALFQQQLDAILVPRPVDSDAKDAVEEYIETSLSSLGWSIERDELIAATPIGPKHFTNIMAHLHPDRPRRLVIACHYETLPFIDGFEGAIDSAVPCAMLLNLASVMTDTVFNQILSDDLTVTLLFFDGEEGMLGTSSADGIYGSTHLADLWERTEYQADPTKYCQTEDANYLDRMEVLFLWDLIGTPAPDFQEFTFGGEAHNAFYQMMMEIEPALQQVLPVSTSSMFNGLITGGSVLDDHTPFYEAAMYRIFYVITRPFPDVWHTLEDNRDCLDFDYIERLNQLLRIWTAQYLQYPGSGGAVSSGAA